MSTESQINEAIQNNTDELAKELLWIRANEGLTSMPWAKLDEVGKKRIDNIYNIILDAMAASNVKGYLDALDDVQGTPNVTNV